MLPSHAAKWRTAQEETPYACACPSIIESCEVCSQALQSVFMFLDILAVHSKGVYYEVERRLEGSAWAVSRTFIAAR